ncbi:unnamed protein product, partial [Ectocarpus sp. 8 AP-2014]
RELVELESRVASWESRAVRAEGLLESVEQPTKYMIDSIREKDGEIEGLRAAQQRLVAKTEALERACREAAEEKSMLKKDLEHLEGAARRAQRSRSHAEGGRRRGRNDDGDRGHRAAGSGAAAASPPPREADGSEGE